MEDWSSEIDNIIIGVFAGFNADVQ